MNAELALKVIQMLLAAEPAVITAIHSLLAGTGTRDDLVVLKADGLAWQAIVDKAQAEIARVKGSVAVPVTS